VSHKTLSGAFCGFGFLWILWRENSRPFFSTLLGPSGGLKFNLRRVSYNTSTNRLWNPLKIDVNRNNLFEVPILHIVPPDSGGPVGNAKLRLYKNAITGGNLISEVSMNLNSGGFSQNIVINDGALDPGESGNLYFVLSGDGDNEVNNNTLVVPYQAMPIVRELGRGGPGGWGIGLGETAQGFLNLDFFANSISGSSPPDNDWFAVQAWSYTDGWNPVYNWYHAVNTSPTNNSSGDAYSIEFDGVNRIEIDGNDVAIPSDYSLQSWWGTRVWLVFHSYTTGERDFLSLEAPPPSVNFKYDSDNDGIFEEIPSNTLDLPPPSSSIHKLEFGTNFPALPNDGGLKVSINPYGHYKIYSDPAGNDNIMDRFLLPDYDEKSFDLSNSSERSEIQNLVSNGIYVEPLVSTMVRNSSSLGIEITDNANRVISSVSLNLTIEEPKMQIPTQIDNLLTAPSKPDLANLRSRLRNEFAVFQSSKMSRLNPNLIGMAPRFGNLDMIAQYIYINPAPSLSTLKQISSNIKTHTGATYKSQISAEQAVVGILYHEVLEKDIQNGLRVVPPSQTPSGFSFDAGKVTSLKREAWVRFETDRFLIRVGYPTFYPPAWSHQDFVDFVFKLEKASSSQHGVGGERRRIKPNENSLKVFEKDYHLKFYFDRIIWTFPPAP